MCNLYSITTNQAAIIALFRVINRYVGNLPPMPGVFPDYPADVAAACSSSLQCWEQRYAAVLTGRAPATTRPLEEAPGSFAPCH